MSLTSYEGIDTDSNSTLTFELNARLSGEVDSLADVKIQELAGCEPLQAFEIDTSFIPENKKIILTYSGNAEKAPILYYSKDDVHNPTIVQIPDGKLSTAISYKVGGISTSENGLIVDVGYLGRGNDFFYTTSLSDLNFEVQDINMIEATEKKTKQLDPRFYDYATDTVETLKNGLEDFMQLLSDLPEFEIDSSYRYCVDLFGGGTIYHLKNGLTLSKLIEFGTDLDDIRHGAFYGNRLQTIGGNLVLIDDESELVYGGTYAAKLPEHMRYRGFMGFKPTDISENRGQKHPFNKSLMEELL